MSQNTIEFDVELVFPDKDLRLDPNRYTGNEPRITEALLQKGLANAKGYFTRKGRAYFTDNEASRSINQPWHTWSNPYDDRFDRECTGRRYQEYVLTCPRKVILSFSFNRDDFCGDPLHYKGKIDPLLVEQGFFNKNGYLTAKAIAILNKPKVLVPQGQNEKKSKKAVAK